MTAISPPRFKTWQMSAGLVYGPFPTRRKGMSLGINLLPANFKVCNFNCVYCQCGWTGPDWNQPAHHPEALPTAAEVRAGLGTRFAAIVAAGQRVDAIVLSGNGEPTLHPDFPGCVDALLAARDRHFPATSVEVLSNGTRVHRPEIAAAIRQLDRIILKLDAGHARAQQRVNLPLEADFDLNALESAYRGLGRYTIQTCFVAGAIDNSGEADVEAWTQRLARLRPERAQIYSLDREPPAPGLEQVPRARLEAIAARARAVTGLAVDVF